MFSSAFSFRFALSENGTLYLDVLLGTVFCQILSIAAVSTKGMFRHVSFKLVGHYHEIVENF